MILLDEELLQDYVTECREHLVAIEAEMLALEEGGAEVDEELINKVFRAAHSIKGGAGLLGLGTLKELAHRTENVLGLIRSRELVPTPEVVNILLLAFDRLRDLVNDLKSSDQADITDIAVALTGLSSSSLPPEQKASLTRDAELQVPDSTERASVRASMFDFDRAKRSSKTVYLIEYDIEQMPSDTRPSPLEVLGRLGEQGTILDCTVVQESTDDPTKSSPSLHVLFATAIDESTIGQLLSIPARKIRRVDAKARDPENEHAIALAPAPLGELPHFEASSAVPLELVVPAPEGHPPSSSPARAAQPPPKNMIEI